MSKTVYCLSWLEWMGEAHEGREAPKRRMTHSFDTQKGRDEFLLAEKEKDYFLYVLSQWEEVILR